MRKCCFIIPYFGKFPNYFPLFLKSCANNMDFDWLVVTDTNVPYNYPENFRVLKMTFEELRNLFQAKFDFELFLNSPYKLCDYKPAYGYVFEEYLHDYAFWGHCDVDTIMGNLSAFITTELMDNYDKIFCLGHMTLYRNSIENNRAFMSTFNGKNLYKKVFTTNKICWFDEEFFDANNINELFISLGKRVFTADYSLNFNIFHSKFIKTTYVGKIDTADSHGYELETYKKCLYLWDNGRILRYYLSDGKCVEEEYAYMHLQKRKMLFVPSLIKYNKIRIVANMFMRFSQKEINADIIGKIKEYPNLQYYYIHILPRIRHLITKL